MNRYAFRIHYSHDPRRIGNMLLSSEGVAAALLRFRDALPTYMAEMRARAELTDPAQRHPHALRVVVFTPLDWAKASVAMAAFADRHGLRATHVASALMPAVLERVPLGRRMAMGFAAR